MTNRFIMKIRLCVYLLSCFFMLPICLHSQTMNTDLDQIVVPPPNAASLGKYGDTPISHFTGLPDISIPFYTCVEGDITVPFKLSYHNSGIRVSEAASWVGANWSLQAGGSIFRTVAGLEDETVGEGYFDNGANLTGTIEERSQVLQKFIDSQPDIFTYNFNGYVGKFFSDGAGGFVTVNRNDFKVSWVAFDHFLIVTPDGMRYHFGTVDDRSAFDIVHNADDLPDNVNENEGARSAAIDGYVSAWHLLKIESPNLTHEVNFYYVQEQYAYPQRVDGFYQYVRADQQGGFFDPGCESNTNGTIDNNSGRFTEFAVNAYRLSQITTSTHQVDFNALNPRTDLGVYPQDIDSLFFPRQLDCIDIYDGFACQKFIFNYDYYVDENYTGNPYEYFNKRLKLNLFRESNCSSPFTYKPPYLFDYKNSDPDAMEDDIIHFPNLLSRSVDYWGYYNGANNDDATIMIPPQSIQFDGQTINLGDADRNVYEDYAIQGSLERITYPTGGYTHFVMESHQAYYSDFPYYDTGNGLTYSNQAVGGLRLKQITHSDGDSDASNDIIRNYTYTDADDPSKSSGVVYTPPKYLVGIILNSINPQYPNAQAYYMRAGGNAFIPLSSFEGRHIGYSNIIEQCPNNGYTQYEYQTATYPNNASFPYPAPTPTAENGRFLKKSVFEQNSSLPTQEEVYNYIEDDLTTVYQPHFNYNIVSGIPCFNEELISVSTLAQLWNRVDTIVTTLDGVSTLTTNEYDSEGDHTQLLKTGTTNSDGKIHSVRYTYPKDINTSIYLAMSDRNMINKPVETLHLVDGVIVDGLRIFHNAFTNQGQLTFTIDDSVHFHPRQFFNYDMHWTDSGIPDPYGWEPEGIIHEYTDRGYPKKVSKTYWGLELYEWDNDLLLQRTFNDHTWQYTYYPNSRLLQTSTDIDGQVTSYHYDIFSRLSSIQERYGNLVTDFQYLYEADGFASNSLRTNVVYSPESTGTSQLDKITIYEHLDGLGRPIQYLKRNYYNEDENGIYKHVANAMVYDSEGRIIREYEMKNTGAALSPIYYTGFTDSDPYSETSYEPSPLKRMIGHIPASWHQRIMLYETNIDNEIIDPLTNIFYAANSLYKQTLIDPNGNQQIEYTDKRGRLVASTKAGDNQEAVTTYSYNGKDQIEAIYPPNATSFADPSDLIYTYKYDVEGNLVEQKTPGKAAIKYLYDDRKLQVGMQNSILFNDNKWHISNYDAYGRIVETGFKNTLNAPNPSNPIAIDDSLTITYYDGYDGTNTSTSPQYVGRIKKTAVKILEDNNFTDTWVERNYTYDPHGRNTHIAGNNYTPFSTEYWVYSYDWGDNITGEYREQNTLGSSTQTILTHNYDQKGRRIKSSHVSGSPSANIELASYSYSPKDELIEKNIGKTTSAVDYLQSMDYQYNAQGWLTHINTPNGNPANEAIDTCAAIAPPPANIAWAFSPVDANDLFSLELGYDTNNGNLDATAQLNGNIAYAIWQTRGRKRQGYGFAYDYQNRLTKATYGQDDLGGMQRNDFYSTAYAYDSRGNFTHLMRNGLYYQDGSDCLSFAPIDNLSYLYYPGTNQVKQIIENLGFCRVNWAIQAPVINSGIYSAHQYVSGNNTVDPEINVTYQSENCVLLEAGFEFNPSDEGSFLAQIGPCVAEDNNANFVNSEGAAGQGFVQTSDDDYLYDDNGNMIQDPNKQLNIEYNYLNLPYRISSYDGSKVIRIDYDATGKKIRKAVLNSDNNTGYTQSYLDGIEYRNINPEAIYLPEGRLFNTGSTWRYEFDLKDHLGNTRVTFSDKNNDGIIQFDDNNDLINEILSEQQTYPFGLACRGPWYTSPSPTKYQFGGKEFNDDFGLDWSDYGARWYDSTAARWWSVDPLADEAPSWTPYRYAFNNPLLYTDPDGLFEDKAAAKQYAKDNDIKTGWFSGNRIRKQDDGSFAISSTTMIDNGGVLMTSETLTFDLGKDKDGESLGVGTSIAISPTDVVNKDEHLFSTEYTHRDGTTTSFDRPSLGLPGGAAAKGGMTLMGSGGYTFGQLRKALLAAYKKLGVKSLPKFKKGKFGSAQRGSSKKGVRLDKQGHPKTTNPNETGPHINWWDFTKGKRGKGGKSDAVKIE